MHVHASAMIDYAKFIEENKIESLKTAILTAKVKKQLD